MDWYPEEQLLSHLGNAVPGILESQSPNGEFGTAPWISTDQNVLLALAAAYTLPASRHHGDDSLLDAIGRGGVALAEAQDDSGMWEFRKKDGSEWGPIRMPWSYSRWMRAYHHVGAQLPADVSQRWAGGLQLGFAGIYDELEIVHEEQMSAQQVAEARRTAAASQAYRFVRIHNIPAHHAMALAFAGQVFDRPDWRDRAAAYLRAVADAQSEHGWWEEHGGPVVAYNFVYVDVLGVYLTLTGDEAVRPALERAARYHAEFTYPDGSAVETVDGRNPYAAGVRLGNSGFTKTAAGRGFLQRQHRLFLEGGGTFDADYAALQLLYGEGGTTSVPAGERQSHDYRMGDMARTVRRRPWFVCLSAIATEIPVGRFGQDRQNFLSLYHDRVGLILGGGNTKLQPLWSSFTVGDTSLLRHQSGDEDPDFSARAGLLHVPDAATLGEDEETPSVTLRYGATVCQIRVNHRGEDEVELELSQDGDASDVEAHVTLLAQLDQSLRADDGTEWILGEKDVVVEGSDGGWIEQGGWHLSLPAGSRCTWPVLSHDPYRKDGQATLDKARIVVTVPLPDDLPRRLTLTVS